MKKQCSQCGKHRRMQRTMTMCFECRDAQLAENTFIIQRLETAARSVQDLQPRKNGGSFYQKPHWEMR